MNLIRTAGLPVSSANFHIRDWSEIGSPYARTARNKIEFSFLAKAKGLVSAFKTPCSLYAEGVGAMVVGVVEAKTQGFENSVFIITVTPTC